MSSAILEGSAVTLAEAPDQPECGPIRPRFNAPARGLILLLLSPLEAGQRHEVYPDTELRAGLAPSGSATAGYFYDDVREKEWKGWVEISDRSPSRLVGTFELSAEGAQLSGAFDATGCP